MNRLALLLPALLAAGCAPLRQSRTTLREERIVADSTLVQLLRRENDHRIGTLRQTVVEYLPVGPDTLAVPAAPPAATPRRIVCTEITLQHDRTVTTDSLGSRTEQLEQHLRSDERLRERPSNGVQRLRWTVLLAVVLAAIGLLYRRLRR